jgi:hypothetical protein
MTTPLETSFAADGPFHSRKRGLARMVDEVLHFFFKPANVLPLGVMRICAGAVILYIHLVYSYDLFALMGKDAWLSLQTVNDLRKDAPVVNQISGWYWSPPVGKPSSPEEKKALEDYYAKWGVDKRELYTTGNPVWSIWYDVTDPRWMVFVHVAVLVCIFCFMIGFCTRVTAVLTWLGTLSYIQRAPSTLFGMDTMQNIILFYMMIAGLLGAAGATVSIDRLIADRWNRLWAKRGGTGVNNQFPSIAGNFILRMFQIHFCIIYIASGLSKLQGPSWWNGMAPWGVMANPQFNPLHVSWYMSMLLFLSHHRWLWELTMHANTVFTLSMEIGFPFLIWMKRWRWIMIVGAVMLHTGIALVMGLVGFSMLMLCMLLCFVPAETMHRLVEQLKELAMQSAAVLGLPPARREEHLALSR